MNDERADEQVGSGLDRRAFMQGIALASLAVPTAMTLLDPAAAAAAGRPATTAAPTNPAAPATAQSVKAFAAANLKNNGHLGVPQLFAVTANGDVYTTWQTGTLSDRPPKWHAWQLHPNSRNAGLKPPGGAQPSIAVAPRSNSDLQLWVSYDRGSGRPEIYTCCHLPA